MFPIPKTFPFLHNKIAKSNPHEISFILIFKFKFLIIFSFLLLNQQKISFDLVKIKLNFLFETKFSMFFFIGFSKNSFSLLQKEKNSLLLLI